MNPTGQGFFAGSPFSTQKHGNIARANLDSPLSHLEHGRRAAEQNIIRRYALDGAALRLRS
jgi:hypothetical protein